MSFSGETELIRFLTRGIPQKKSQLVLGTGDDAAAFGGKKHPWVVTTDMLVEDVDFRRRWSSPEDWAWKSLAVNASDLAAMGATPVFYVMSLGMPRSFSSQEAKSFRRGMRRAERAFDVHLIGGDLSRSREIVISVTMWGQGRRLLKRNAARPGDNLFVSGTLGGAALGLKLAEAGEKNKWVRRLNHPEPRVKLGAWLARQPHVHAVMDLSDGLSGDLKKILAASGVNAEVESSKIPKCSGFVSAARRRNLDPLALQLHGGEDFELLFTAAPSWQSPKQVGGVSLTRIGVVQASMRGRAGKLYLLDDSGHRFQVEEGAFSHF